MSIQNHSVRKVPTAFVNETLAEMLRKAGFATEQLEFQPPADVEHMAQIAHCDYILYSDIVHVSRTAGSQAAKAMHTLGKPFGAKGPGPREMVEAEVEFRMFGMDEVLPKISTSVQGKSRRTDGQRLPSVTIRVEYAGTEVPGDAKSGVVQISEDPAPATSALMDPAKISALQAAFEKTAKAVRGAIESKAQTETAERN